MENFETGARFANPEEHAVILLTAVKGCAVEESIVGLHKATYWVVAVREPAGALGEGKEPGELSGRGQFEKCAALGIGHALIGNLCRAVKVSVRGLNDEIGPPSLRTGFATDAVSTGESKYLMDGSRALCAGGYRQRQADNEGHNRSGAVTIQ